LSPIVDADHIVVLGLGRVVEQGTHADLLDKQGIYASLWELQQREAPVAWSAVPGMWASWIKWP